MEAVRMITFRVGSQLLAVPLDQVREVIRYVPVAPAAAWTGLLHGIIHLRDKVVPILDLRQMFGTGQQQASRRTRIIVAEILGRLAGLVVDQVDDIVPLNQEQLIPLSSLPVEKKSAILVAVAKVENQTYLVLDVKELIHQEEREHFCDICLQLNQAVQPTSGKERL
jgi:purine-binding chemotaxis protein CheW